MDDRCTRIVRSGWNYKTPCSRRGIVERDGRKYCKQHDPVAIAERNRLKDEEWNAARRAEKARLDAAASRCAALGSGKPHRDRPSSGPSVYTGGVILDAEEADALVAKLREPRL